MTGKQKLKAVMKLADAMYYAAQNLTTDASRLHKAMEEYRQFVITECKEEPVSEDLEEAAVSYCGGNKGSDARVRAAYVMGANWKIEQILKDAVSATIDYPLIGHDFPNIYPNYRELKYYCDKYKIKDGDKVKVIIIKEE